MSRAVCWLLQEHTLARAIHAIQAALWPGGTWFMYRPEYPRLKVLVGLMLGHNVRPRHLGAAPALQVSMVGSSGSASTLSAPGHYERQRPGRAEGGRRMPAVPARVADISTWHSGDVC